MWAFFFGEPKMRFTEEQLEHLRKYERVRSSGMFNMWDFRAQQAARLTQDQYFFVMEHYNQLREQTEAII
jgi:hypothetical protein